MKFVDFKKSLNDYISPIYVFYGEDRYLIETCIKNLQLACEINLPNMNLSTFNENSNFNDVLLSLETLPFGDKLRLVILNEYELSDNEKELIYNYAQNPNKSVCFAIICGTQSTLIENENITQVDCGKLEETIIKKKITADLRTKGVIISDEALKTLISYCDCSLTKINSELEKLIGYSGENKAITEDMVRDLSIKDINYNIFELTTSLGEKNLDKALKVFNNLLKSEDINAIIGLLYGQFRRMLIIAITSNDMSNETISKSLQVKPYSIKITRNQAKNFGVKKLYALCEKLQQIDIIVKNNFSNIQNELYNFIFIALGE